MKCTVYIRLRLMYMYMRRVFQKVILDFSCSFSGWVFLLRIEVRKSSPPLLKEGPLSPKMGTFRTSNQPRSTRPNPTAIANWNPFLKVAAEQHCKKQQQRGNKPLKKNRNKGLIFYSFPLFLPLSLFLWSLSVVFSILLQYSYIPQ